jgi:hypothetical protein
MAISTYSELKTAVTDWMVRNDVTSSTGDFVTLAEARINRKLGPINTDATLTGTVNSRRVDVSTLSIVQPISLHLVVYGDEEEVTLRPDGSFPYLDDVSQPNFAAFEGNYIDFNTLLDQPYSIRLTYQARLALSDATPTNWLLTQHPDLYLAACIAWGGLYIEDDGKAAKWEGIADRALSEVANIESRKRRGNLVTEVAELLPVGYGYDWTNI